MTVHRSIRPLLTVLLTVAMLTGISALTPSAGAEVVPTGNLVLHVDEVGGSWATALCASPGTPALLQTACAGSGAQAVLDFSVPGGGSVTRALPAGVYNAALSPMTFAAVSPWGPITVVAGQTVECTITMAAVPTCGPATGPEPGNVVVVVGEAAGSWATGFCADPGIPVLGSMTCGVTNLPGQLDLSLAPGATFTLALPAGAYNAAVAPMSLASLSPIGSVTVTAGATVICTFTLAAGPQCVPDDGDGIAEPVGVDGNGDGIADSAQASVATFTPAADGGLVTLAAPDSSYTITGVRALPVPASPALADGVSLPLGVIGFTVTLPSGQRTADIDVIAPPGTNPNSYFKLQNGTWRDFTTQASFAGDTVTLHLVDNDTFDTDPADFVIGDPGGPAVIDETPPTVGLSGPTDGGTYTLGAVPTAGCTATDEPGGSGVGSPACTMSVTGGNANGVGTFTATASATDLAGNSASVTSTYRVVYAVDALRVPFSKVLTTSPVAGAGVAGVPFPVSVTARRADGSVVTPVSARWVEPVKAGSILRPLATTGLPAPVTTASSFTRATDGSMGFTWRTTRSQGLSYWRIGVTLDDGTTHTVIVALL